MYPNTIDECAFCEGERDLLTGFAGRFATPVSKQTKKKGARGPHCLIPLRMDYWTVPVTPPWTSIGVGALMVLLVTVMLRVLRNWMPTLSAVMLLPSMI
jgi:hypothetical protein